MGNTVKVLLKKKEKILSNAVLNKENLKVDHPLSKTCLFQTPRLKGIKFIFQEHSGVRAIFLSLLLHLFN